ncbi:hypothetical protein E2C01_000890 [Portunus trituberculatus]|uniref:Uncharacterized protein n=1 Tax=Portunus trituberculatus TaxID=210409 RepID=A0A5B7CFI6_PORTR|nr:hypothetical protein [Portunus trituberculatus]
MSPAMDATATASSIPPRYRRVGKGAHRSTLPSSPPPSLSLSLSPAVVVPAATTRGEGSPRPHQRRVAGRRHTRPRSQPPPCTCRGYRFPPSLLHKCVEISDHV